jgi:hypothetical protein
MNIEHRNESEHDIDIEVHALIKAQSVLLLSSLCYVIILTSYASRVERLQAVAPVGLYKCLLIPPNCTD